MRLPTPQPPRAAETNHVWVIVPLSRPENVQNVYENFVRQRFPFKKMVAVANGRAERDSRVQLLERAGAVVLTCDAHQSSAKNTALAEIRKRGGGFTAVMDDDDWYGPQYLAEVCSYARSYEVIGKSRHFMSVDGALWLCSRERANRETGWLTGGTIACWAEDAAEYTHVRWGEDAAFCHVMKKKGARIRGTDLYHYLYRRESNTDHAWDVDVAKLRRIESGAGALDLGAVDLAIIEGRKLEVEGRVLDWQEDIETLPPPAPGVTRVAS